MQEAKPESVEEYIDSFDAVTKDILLAVRKTIQSAAPDATEKISYGMPAFVYKGNLVYYAAYAKHIGFYATPNGNESFKKELSKYKTGKGSIQFPIAEQMPLELIKRIVAFRVRENDAKAEAKKLRK
ncbi:hypothetical protein G6047_08000 [Flavobacterium sp. SE-s28]|uniref:YdhG-like domain-containing protein n=2 Tax=Flavobacterium silvaticum TaxID=1852020 RepID=A0A972JG96_9FLAO|nr:hypothetical protein [Flavobacterium silvaticum]